MPAHQHRSAQLCSSGAASDHRGVECKLKHDCGDLALFAITHRLGFVLSPTDAHRLRGQQRARGVGPRGSTACSCRAIGRSLREPIVLAPVLGVVFSLLRRWPSREAVSDSSSS